MLQLGDKMKPYKPHSGVADTHEFKRGIIVKAHFGDVIMRSLFGSCILALCAGPVLAGGIAEQPTPPAIVPAAPDAASTDFAGGYVGLSFGHVSGDVTETLGLVGGGTVSNDRDIGGDQAHGIFAGYNWQRGNLVYGAELTAWAVSAPIVGPIELTTLTDIRGRVGFAAGNALFYGAVGWAWGTWKNTSSGFDIGVDGHSFGLGVEYNVTERLFVGLDYTARSMEGSGPAIDLDMDVSTVALRGGFRF
jgi:outer membrane immunogenic protein